MSYVQEHTNAYVHDYRDVGGRATAGAVAEDVLYDAAVCCKKQRISSTVGLEQEFCPFNRNLPLRNEEEWINVALLISWDIMAQRFSGHESSLM
jgi:hypothetical protein